MNFNLPHKELPKIDVSVSVKEVRVSVTSDITLTDKTLTIASENNHRDVVEFKDMGNGQIRLREGCDRYLEKTMEEDDIVELIDSLICLSKIPYQLKKS